MPEKIVKQRGLMKYTGIASDHTPKENAHNTEDVTGHVQSNIGIAGRKNRGAKVVKSNWVEDTGMRKYP